MTNEDLMEIFSQQDLLQMMEGRKVHGVKLTKEQRREIKFAYGRGITLLIILGEQIDLKKYLNPRED
jgi:large subunit GTPase 1